MIVCLGWGSLVWDPQGLEVLPPWRLDGPVLPIEYARESKDGRLTLVVLLQGAPCVTLWAPFDTDRVATAREALRLREGPTREEWIGQWSEGETSQNAIERAIETWAIAREVSTVLWAALPPKFAGEDGRAPDQREALAYLAALRGVKREAAEKYIRRTPHQIRTSYRTAIEASLGWEADA